MHTNFNTFNSLLSKAISVCKFRHYGLSRIVFNKTEVNLENWKEELANTMRVVPNFISIAEEESLMAEVDPYMKKLRYEQSHWDDAIHSYRETERSKWNENNAKIISKIRETAFPKGSPQLSLIHILDLSAEGWIKPHVDSVRFCGEIIAGLSLLTDSVMRLRMVSNEKLYKDFLLPRRSLYIMSGAARYHYNHEILKNAESYFEGEHVPKGRRISIICRSQPDGEI